jgi:hypothetical protein
MLRMNDNFALVIFVAWWLCGIAVAHGFWNIVLAVCLPPYAMILFVQYLLGV